MSLIDSPAKIGTTYNKNISYYFRKYFNHKLAIHALFYKYITSKNIQKHNTKVNLLTIGNLWFHISIL